MSRLIFATHEMSFDRDNAESLAARLRAVDRRQRPELCRRVAERHSVEHWADALLSTVQGR